MGIWIFHRCNSKRGWFFYFLNESSALCDGKVYVYISAEKIPYSIFPACFSSRAARARVYAATHRGYIFLLQFTKWKRAEYTQATSQSANQPGTQSKCTVKIPAAEHIYILLRALLYMYMCSAMYICEHTEANTARSPATAADAKLAK